MTTKSPYQVIKSRYLTEKVNTLKNLTSADNNPSVRKYKNIKIAFVVDKRANKQEIAKAVIEIYKELNPKVLKVNTINTKRKPRRVRGRKGLTPSFKKAIVTIDVEIE